MLKIEDSHGLHARPAALFVKAVKPFQAEIMVQCGEGSANGKSVLSLMVLGARVGDVLTVIAEGPDAADALQALDCLFQQQPFMRSAIHERPPVQVTLAPCSRCELLV
ncbi:MAG: HPr family phosphocarrier protein [Verrucomicrobiota bacterium]